MANKRQSKQSKMLSTAYNIQLFFNALKSELNDVTEQKPFYFPILIENVDNEIQRMIDECVGEHDRVQKLSQNRRRKAGE